MGSDPALRLALFDCDGTLVDSQHAIVAAMAAASGAVGLSAPAPMAVRRVVGLSLVEAVATLWPGHDSVWHERIAGHYREAFADLRRQNDLLEPLFPGIFQALERLAEADVLLGVATGKSMRGLQAILDRHDLRRFFVTLQTADHGPGKPHPDMVYRALADLGVDRASTAMIGDTTYDILMARRAGVAAIGVAWGYHAPEELAAAGADAVVAEGSAVPPAVLQLIAGFSQRSGETE